ALLSADQTLTYAELNQRIDQFADYLAQQGVKAGSLVGVHLQPGFDLITSLLAVFKLNAAYLPLDLSYPHERLYYMVNDSQPQVIVTSQSSPSTFGDKTLISIEKMAAHKINQLPK